MSNPQLSTSRRLILWAGVACIFIFSYVFLYQPQNNVSQYVSALLPWSYNATRDANNYGLSEAQCNSAFPRLFDPIDENVRNLERPIEREDIDGVSHWCEAQAILYDNEVILQPCPSMRLHLPASRSAVTQRIVYTDAIITTTSYTSRKIGLIPTPTTANFPLCTPSAAQSPPSPRQAKSFQISNLPSLTATRTLIAPAQTGPTIAR